MNNLNQTSALKDISSLVTVQTYTMLNNAEIAVRIQLGDGSNGIQGGALYKFRYSINGLIREDLIEIGSGITKSFFQGPKISVFAGEVIILSVQGRTADTNVRIVSQINDVTSEISGLFAGGNSGSVWSEEEKQLLLKSVSQIKISLKKILNKPDATAGIKEVKKNIRALIESRDLTKLENKVNLLYENVLEGYLKTDSIYKNILETKSSIDENTLINKIIEAISVEQIDDIKETSEPIQPLGEECIV